MEHPINLTEPDEPEMTPTESAADVTVDETSETYFQTPEPPPPLHQPPPNMGPRRTLVFTPDAEQTTPPTTPVRPREEEEEEQREAEKLLLKAELQKRIKETEQKMAEVKSSAFDFKVSLDNECLEIYNVFSEVKKVVEAALQRSLQPVEERRERVKREGKDLLQRLKRETVKLQMIIAELDRNPDLQISLDETTDRSNTSVDTLERGLRSPLPMILLSNVHSLFNKMDELRLLITTNTEFAHSSVLCFTESWLTKNKLDVQLNGFQLLRADRDLILSGKKRGGGICFYINDGWCSDVKVISRYSSPDLETFFITCRPFFPCEFTSFILAGVYIPPEADVGEAQRQLAKLIQGVKGRREFMSSTVIVLGDFNQANLSLELPEYKQFVKCPTRGKKTLDHCYSTISKAYRAVPHAPLGGSDHALIHLIPTYILELNLPKPAVLRSKNWSSRAAVDELCDCLDNTDWETFRTASNSLDKYTDAVTSYISVGGPTRTRVRCNNDKPWFTAELTHLRLEKEAAFKSVDMDSFRLAKYLFDWAMEEAKRQYSKKLKQQFAAKTNSPKT